MADENQNKQDDTKTPDKPKKLDFNIESLGVNSFNPDGGVLKDGLEDD